MGVVYRGVHRSTGAEVALKTVQLVSPEQIAAFRQEVQVLAELDHPGIVRIIEQGVASGTPWYAMELVKGRPLSTLLRGPLASQSASIGRRRSTAPLIGDFAAQRDTAALTPERIQEQGDRPPLVDLLRIMRKVASALAFLHAHGLVHRDLKPANILIQPDDNPVLVDFGIVGQFGDKAGREVLKLARWAGTLAYMAPEQASGPLVDARADMFSLGCILYECIVGELPFGESGLYDASLNPPTPPSRRVDGISPELDQLVLGLLAKDARDRIGYAEDVVKALDRLTRAPVVDAALGSQVTYLYRPEFAGRQAALERLSGLLMQSAERQSTIALVTGESGLGKTRLLLELGARAVAAGAHVITGECAPIAATQIEEGARREALHPFRSFLVAVADACRAGGAEVSERLLGQHGGVLAPYEPALAAVLPLGVEQPEPLAPERARGRVLAALESVISAFAAERPLVLLIDDLQWADGLSLEFLARFADHVGARSQVSLIATCRSEEMPGELGALCSHASVNVEKLERFDRDAVSQIVSGLLAVSSPPSDWVSFLQEESAGNPFFIAEYLRAAIAERLLTRGSSGRWTLGEGSNLRDRLGLPASIGALVGRRLRGLDQRALRAVHAAAVLGRRFDLGLLSQTAGVDAAQVAAGCADLRERQILDDDASGRLGFVHDKVREVAYGLIVDEERGLLHRRAADALEARLTEGETSIDLGTLGYHHAQAGSSEQAARRFAEAAERARMTYANRDAIRLYRLALSEAARAPTADLRRRRQNTSRLQEALGEVLLLTGQHEAARSALEAALADTTPAERVARARRQRLLARTWEKVHQHERALALLVEAERGLEEGLQAADELEASWFERVQTQLEFGQHLYFLSRLDELATRVDRVRPVIEERGTPLQRAQFFYVVFIMRARRDRYRIDEEMLQVGHAGISAASESGDPLELAIARFGLGFMLTLARREAEAEPLFAAALASVERLGDTALEARILAYYTTMHRRLGRIAETRAMATRALAIAERHGFYDYIGVARANLAWVALALGGDVDEAAARALSAWQALPANYPYPLQWLARAPLAAHLGQTGRAHEALSHWEQMLAPTQAQLPDELRLAIEAALGKRSQGVLAPPSLLPIVEAARKFGYL